MHRLSMLSMSMIVSLAGLGAASPVWATLPPAPAGVQVTTEYGIEFSTVGNPGNAAGSSFRIGRVDYSYRIARTEVTTDQWMQFLNTFSTRESADPLFSFFQYGPFPWGAVEDPKYSGPGVRWVINNTIPSAAMVPVNMSWRAAAIYCNWLHNGQSADWSALQNGAYDITTFTRSATDNSVYNDQRTHNPDAKFWIPSIDEWSKAAHYDPNKGGLGVGGYWEYGIRSDTPPIYGPPGIGQVNTGFHYPDFSEQLIPLGAYPDSQSAYGLLDVIGGRSEWTESPTPFFGERYGAGTGAGGGTEPYIQALNAFSSGAFVFSRPDQAVGGSVRVASAIPSPQSIAMVLIMSTSVFVKRRRMQ